MRDGRVWRGAEWREEEARLGGGYARRRTSGGARFETRARMGKRDPPGVATARGAGGRTHPYSGTRRWIRTSCTTATTATTAYAPASASNVRSCEEEEAGEQGQTDAPRGGGAPGEAPGAPFFSPSRAEASAAGTRLVVRVVGPGREERTARGAVGARVRGHGRNARLEEWVRRVARNRRLSNHDRKNLPPRKWTRRPRREKAARARRVGLQSAGSGKTTAFTAPALAALAATPPCREDARGRAPRRRAWMTCVSFVLARRPLSHPRRVARDPPSVDERAVPRSRAQRLRA